MNNQLERLQVLTEIIREFKTAILNDIEPDRMGEAVLEVIQEAGDTKLADFVLQAYMKRTDESLSVYYLDQATAYLHEEIDKVI